MKAISSSPGLLAYTANESPGPYQTVTPDTEVEMSSHSGTSRHEHLGIQEGTILEHHYDYPNTPVESQAQITSESQAVAMNQKSSADVTSTASQDKDSYSDIKLLDATTGRETADDHEYEDMSRSIPATQVKGPRDKELSVLAGHLLNMNPSEAILWLLDQIHQVVVEKFVGVHESKVVESSIQEIEEIYDEVQITASTLPVPPRATSTERVQTSYPRDTLSSVHELISCQSNVAYYSGNKASPSKSIPKAEKLPHYHLPAVRPPPVRQKLDSCGNYF